MPKVACRVIPKPKEETRAVLTWNGPADQPFMKGNPGPGLATYVCGECGRNLVENIPIGQVRNIVFKCPKCESYNEIPGLE